MKVVLRENVDQLGRRGDVVTVAAGYGRNYLVPKGLAYRFTEGTVRQVRAESRKKELQESRERDAATALAGRLNALEPLSFEKRSGEGGHLYGSVTTVEIASAIRERGIEIERRQILLSGPIKELGEHDVAVRLYQDVNADLKIIVEPEGGYIPEPPAEESAAEEDQDRDEDHED